jgi:two-component system OmpR family response regulator
MAGEQKVVLVADDDDAMRLLCRVNLELEGYRVLEAATGAATRLAVEQELVALLLLDVRLGEEDGIALARSLREEHPDLRIVFLTGSAPKGSEELVVADAVIMKPFTLEELSGTVARLAPR